MACLVRQSALALALDQQTLHLAQTSLDCCLNIHKAHKKETMETTIHQSPNNVTQAIRNKVLGCFSDVDEVWDDHEPKPTFSDLKHMGYKRKISILIPTHKIL